MELNLLTPAEALYWAGRIVLESGKKQNSRGRDTREAQHVTLHVKYPHLDPLTLAGRIPGFNRTIGALEACQLVGQTSDPDGTADRVRALGAYRDGDLFWGAYGPRVAGQLARAETLLLGDPGTRQAVVSIYDGSRDLMATPNGLDHAKDIPCTLTAQFMWEEWPGETRLGMRLSMRSNDVFLGLPYDLFQFTALQMAMADALEVRPGWYVHTVGSMHAYAVDLDQIEAIHSPSQPPADELDYDEPRWRGHSISAISTRARRILLGRPIELPTSFEGSLMGALR